MRCLEAYLRAIGPQVLGWYADPYSGDWEELDDKGWAFLRRDMREEPSTYFWLAESPSETTGYEVLYHGRLLEKNVTSALSFILPTEYLEAHGPGHVGNWRWSWRRSCPSAPDMGACASTTRRASSA